MLNLIPLSSLCFTTSPPIQKPPSGTVLSVPKTPLDGELWCGRGLFQTCVSIVKTKLNVSEEDWRCLTYLVFDAPAISAPYEDRLNYLKSTIKIPTNWQTETYTTYAALVGVQRCQSREHLQRTLDDVLKLGGEGVMLRQPRSFYEHKRSDTLRKVKRFYDEEALVIGHQMGKGRCLNMMGCLKCKLPNGIEFAIGSGFDDAIRRKPPRIDSVVTFKFQELTKAGKPRFPVFLRERSDMTWEGVLQNAKTKIPFSEKPKMIADLKTQHSILFSAIPSRDKTGKVVRDNAEIFEEADNAKEDEEGPEKGKEKEKNEEETETGKGKEKEKDEEETEQEKGNEKEDEEETEKGKGKGKEKDEEQTGKRNEKNAAHQQSASSPTRQLCRQGRKCTTADAAHHERYLHPPKRKETEVTEKGNPKGPSEPSCSSKAPSKRLRTEDA